MKLIAIFVLLLILACIKIRQNVKKIELAEKEIINSTENKKAHELDNRGSVDPETDRKYLLATATDLVNALIGAPDPSRVAGLEYEQWYDNQRRSALIKAFPSVDKIERDRNEAKKQNNHIV